MEQSPIVINPSPTSLSRQVARESLPEKLWEVLGARGGKGGSQLFTSEPHAQNLRRQIIRLAEMISVGKDPGLQRHLLHKYAQEDEQKSGLPSGSLHEAATGAVTPYPDRSLNLYLSSRSQKLGEHPSPWLHFPDFSTHIDPDHPVIEQVHNLAPGNLNIGTVLSHQIPKTSVIRDTGINGALKLEHHPGKPVVVVPGGGLGDVVKGLNGDWRSEGYTIHHELVPETYHGNSESDLQVIASHPDHGEVGWAYVHHDDDDINHIYTNNVSVKESHRRKGLADAMYHHAESASGKKLLLSPYTTQTPEAIAFWNRSGRKFGNVSQPHLERKLEAHPSIIAKAYQNPVEPPKNTVKAYKLFRIDPRKPGELFPLFVNGNKSVPLGKWIPAESGPPMPGGGVKSSLGKLAYRPGWHSGDLPVATHIGGKSQPGLGAPDIRPENHVRAEVEVPHDVDWQSVANSRDFNKVGKFIPKNAHVTDQIPVGGHYRYKTNSNMTGNWLISGAIKVNRVLPDHEVEAINRQHGVSDLPRTKPSLWRDPSDITKSYYPHSMHPMVQEALDHFGTTENPHHVGYILRDGRMLNFSGEHSTRNPEEKEEFRQNDMRGADHVDIAQIPSLAKGGHFDPIHEFLHQTGAIRYDKQGDHRVVQTAHPLSLEQHRRVLSMAPENGGLLGEVSARKSYEPKYTISQRYQGKYNFGRLLNNLDSAATQAHGQWVSKALGGRGSEADDVWWHGSINGDLRGGRTGLHLGTRASAEDALNARIGFPAEGHWDNTREYGKTLLAGRKTLQARGLSMSGRNAQPPEEDYLHHEHRDGALKHWNGEAVDPSSKPRLEPFRITGKMTNSIFSPHNDWKANGYMSAALKKGNAKSGYYYTNEGEDYGSASAVVPNGSHIEPHPDHQTLTKALSPYVASLRRAESQTELNPSIPKVEAGNARKGKFQWNGLTITIENPKGSIRRGKNPERPWQVTMGCAYGYFNSQPLGRDGDPVDVFVCDDNLDSDWVYIVNQCKQDGSFDEHKTIIGCSNEKQVRTAYLSCYSSGWKCGNIKAMHVGEFKKWLASGKRGVVKSVPIVIMRAMGDLVNPNLHSLVESYRNTHGINTPHLGNVGLDTENSKRIADAYEVMPHTPNDPKVKASYQALADQTVAQHDHLIKHGYRFTPWRQEGQPYADSNEMLKDLHENKHLHYFPTDQGFGTEPGSDNNPLLGDSGRKASNGEPMLVNDVFRAVHDVFGHGVHGYSFGPLGEERAWHKHASMYTPEAVPALTTETRGQNSWVNFGKHLRKSDGTIPNKEESGWVHPADRPYAEQKSGFLPSWVTSSDNVVRPKGIKS